MLHQKDGDKLPYIQKRLDANLHVNEADQEPEISDLTSRFINIFLELSSWREIGDNGPKKISLGLINDYCRFTGVVVDYRDLAIVRAMDDSYLDWYHKLRAKTT